MQITERDGGSVSVLTLGPEAAIEQLRGALALGAHRAVLLETDGQKLGPMSDGGRHRRRGPGPSVRPGAAGQRGGRHRRLPGGLPLAPELGWPVATGIKNLSVEDGGVVARRGSTAAWKRRTSCRCRPSSRSRRASTCRATESLPGRLRAERPAVDRSAPDWAAEGLRKEALRVPESAKSQAECSVSGVNAVPGLVQHPGGDGGALVTVLVLVELDGAAAADASLRALTLARTAWGHFCRRRFVRRHLRTCRRTPSPVTARPTCTWSSRPRSTVTRRRPGHGRSRGCHR